MITFIKQIVMWIKRVFKRVLSLFRSGIEFYKLDYICPGKTHSWVFTSVGRIRKENRNIPDFIFKKA